ncbi:MAG: CooT family nickel-binding protein [Candidatus Altarchaeaceae archaeon]
MCLSTVYIIKDNKKEKIFENIAKVKKEKDKYIFITMFGEQKFITGNIKEIDFLKAEILIE